MIKELMTLSHTIPMLIVTGIIIAAIMLVLLLTLNMFRGEYRKGEITTINYITKVILTITIALFAAFLQYMFCAVVIAQIVSFIFMLCLWTYHYLFNDIPSHLK